MPSQDEQWMRLALELAAKGSGHTSPNPMVGAVLVKEGRIIGSGYHHVAGGPHAEVYALQEAGHEARSATLYVTLEPCSHVGRTPPCASAIIAAGVTRVVAAMTDPNPRVSGSGIARLRQAGIQVEVGLLSQEAGRLNAPFITYMTKHRPYVLWKAAATLDGKVATRTGASRWITGSKARELVHTIRSQMDAIMVGSGTVLADNPLLTARPSECHPNEIHQPLRVILDSHLRIPLTARCLDPHLPGRTIVATTEAAASSNVEALRNQGVEVWMAPAVSGRVHVKQLLHDLAQMGITSILLEGGPTLAGSMLDQRLIDACTVFIAPTLFGGSQAPSVLGGVGVDTPAHAPHLVDTTWRAIGDDYVVEGRLVWPSGEGPSTDEAGDICCSQD